MLISSATAIIQTATLVTAISFVAEARSIPRQTPGISWSACPDSDTTQCAFFDVPRDYANPAENDTVSIFMRKYPGNATGENRLGSILVNPGGPGGSGNLNVLLSGARTSALVDGRYDIIGFDPRGVNLTGPWTACFTTEAAPLSLEYKEIIQGVPFPHSTVAKGRAVIKKLIAIQSAHNAACVERGNRKILESVGTAYSYGTILGATFAAMRPDLVKRMVLDSVSNAESYFNDIWQWGRDGMAGTHKTFDGFLSTCADAGPKYCAFAVPPGNSSITQTTESLRQRLNAIFTQLGKQPMKVPESLGGPGIFTASNLQRLLLSALYSPGIWQSAMEVLAGIEQGDASTAYLAVYGPYLSAQPLPYDQNPFNRSMQHSDATRESIRAILCSDAAPTNISINALTDYYREIGKISPVGESWANILSACNGWDFHASQRFPILFISQDGDPVTPLSSAIKMANGFGNESGTLLIQKGYGHPSVANPSLCTAKHTHDYFVNGIVPPNGTHCTAEPGFIYPSNTKNSKRAALDKRDRELLEAIEGLNEARSKLNLISWGI